MSKAGIGPQGVISAVFHGAATPFRAVKLVRTNPRLRRLATVCALVTAVALAGVIAFSSRYSDDLLGVLWSPPAQGFWKAVWQAARVLVWVLITVLGANTVPLLLLAPLQDPLSEATEQALGQSRDIPRARFALVRDMAVSITHTVQRIALLLGGHLLLLLLHLIPGAGSLAWTVLATLWTTLWLAAEYLDVAMARHLYGFHQVRAVLRRNLGVCLGFGFGLYLLLWVPVLNLFLVPLAVVAGTDLFCALREEGKLPEPSGKEARERGPRLPG